MSDVVSNVQVVAGRTCAFVHTQEVKQPAASECPLTNYDMFVSKPSGFSRFTNSKIANSAGRCHLDMYLVHCIYLVCHYGN